MIVSKFETEDNITIFRLSGKLIASTVDGIKGGMDSALEDEGAMVVINFKLVNIIDSVAVGFLISRFKTAQKKHSYFRFCEMQPAIKQLLAMADLDKWLEIYDFEEDALGSIRADVKA